MVFVMTIMMPTSALLLFLIASCHLDWPDSHHQMNRQDYHYDKADLIVSEVFPINYNRDQFMDFVVSALIWPPEIPGKMVPINVLKGSEQGKLSFLGNKMLAHAQMVHLKKTLVFDFNNDQIMDILFVGHGTDRSPFPGEVSILLEGNQHHEYGDVTKQKIGWGAEFTTDACTGDVNNDGYQDILINSIKPKLYINQKGHSFLEKEKEGLPKDIKDDEYMSCHFFDSDNDGDLDLFLGAYDSDKGHKKDALFLNDGDGNFSYFQSIDIPEREGDKTYGTIFVDSLDINQDKKRDLVIAVHNFGYNKSLAYVLINKGKNRFERKKIVQSFADGCFIPSIDIADFNNDGWDDILFVYRTTVKGAKCSPRLKLYHNIKGNFVDKSLEIPLNENDIFSNAYFIDADSDGQHEIIGFDYKNRYTIFSKSDDLILKWKK